MSRPILREAQLNWLAMQYDHVVAHNTVRGKTLAMPLRVGFYKLALDIGVTTEDFDTWASEREWWKPQ